MQAKADKSKADVKLEYEKQIGALRVRQEALRHKLQELKASGEDAWEDLKDGVEKAWDDLKNAVSGALDRFK